MAAAVVKRTEVRATLKHLA